MSPARPGVHCGVFWDWSDRGDGPGGGVDEPMTVCEVGPAVTGLCEVGPAVTGLCEVGPAETGLARSASCRSDGGLVLEPGRKRVVVRCCLVTVVKRWTKIKVHRHGPESAMAQSPPSGVVCRQARR